ncbi:MAG: hypothetical protein R2867_09105 [Caldilineaceae bacterium]
MTPSTQPQAAIDFGISNTDTIAHVNGEWRRWVQPYTGHPDEAQVRQILAKGDVNLDDLPWLAVTGGRHHLLPETLGSCTIISVGELAAIARGGQALAQSGDEDDLTAQPLLVVSAGSGTAMVRVQGADVAHVTGSAVGGGTCWGWAVSCWVRSIPLKSMNWRGLGHANRVDLSLADVVTESIGTLPADATAVNFGRLARESFVPNRVDLAAELSRWSVRPLRCSRSTPPMPSRLTRSSLPATCSICPAYAVCSRRLRRSTAKPLPSPTTRATPPPWERCWSPASNATQVSAANQSTPHGSVSWHFQSLHPKVNDHAPGAAPPHTKGRYIRHFWTILYTTAFPLFDRGDAMRVKLILPALTEATSPIGGQSNTRSFHRSVWPPWRAIYLPAQK